MKKETKESVNLFSLIAGIILILIGLVGLAITLPLDDISLIPILISVGLLVLGATLALMGGLRKWG